MVPQVTIGLSAEQSTSISLSNVAPSSVCRSFHGVAVEVLGAPALPVSHSKVVSSGAIMPARPPPSMVMLQIVMRPSIESASIAGPANSTA